MRLYTQGWDKLGDDVRAAMVDKYMAMPQKTALTKVTEDDCRVMMKWLHYELKRSGMVGAYVQFAYLPGDIVFVPAKYLNREALGDEIIVKDDPDREVRCRIITAYINELHRVNYKIEILLAKNNYGEQIKKNAVVGVREKWITKNATKIYQGSAREDDPNHGWIPVSESVQAHCVVATEDDGSVKIRTHKEVVALFDDGYCSILHSNFNQQSMRYEFIENPKHGKVIYWRPIPIKPIPDDRRTGGNA